MKIKYFNTTTFIVLIIVILSACNTSTSIKGKWSKEDKEKVKSEIAEVFKEDDDYKEIKKNKDSNKLFDEIMELKKEKEEKVKEKADAKRKGAFSQSAEL